MSRALKAECLRPGSVSLSSGAHWLHSQSYRGFILALESAGPGVRLGRLAPWGTSEAKVALLISIAYDGCGPSPPGLCPSHQCLLPLGFFSVH